MTTITKGEAVELVLEQEMSVIKQEIEQNPFGISKFLVDILKNGTEGLRSYTSRELEIELETYYEPGKYKILG